MCRSKIFVTQWKLLRTLEICYKIFDNSHLKFGERGKAKSKSSIFDGPFSQAEHVIGKSDSAHIINFH